MKNVIKDVNGKIQILKNVKITYNNGSYEHYKTIKLTKKGVFIGHFKKGKSYVEEGFIPKFNIKEIEGEIVNKIFRRIL